MKSFASVHGTQTYRSLTQLFRKNGVAWMAEQMIRPRYPHRFPCDVVWFLDGIVACILSLDIDEGTGKIISRYRNFETPHQTQEGDREFAVAVIG